MYDQLVISNLALTMFWVSHSNYNYIWMSKYLSSPNQKHNNIVIQNVRYISYTYVLIVLSSHRHTLINSM